jgi:hypothetical protein
MIRITIFSLVLLSAPFTVAKAEEAKHQIPPEFERYFSGIHRLNSKYPDAAKRYGLVDMSSAPLSTADPQDHCEICERPGGFFCCPHHGPTRQ